ncbi:hypothetical protein THAOC_21275, partial [Thalassiosira oceanica]
MTPRVRPCPGRAGTPSRRGKGDSPGGGASTPRPGRDGRGVSRGGTGMSRRRGPSPASPGPPSWFAGCGDGDDVNDVRALLNRPSVQLPKLGPSPPALDSMRPVGAGQVFGGSASACSTVTAGRLTDRERHRPPDSLSIRGVSDVGYQRSPKRFERCSVAQDPNVVDLMENEPGGDDNDGNDKQKKEKRPAGCKELAL